jgi:hypothetical protein
MEALGKIPIEKTTLQFSAWVYGCMYKLLGFCCLQCNRKSRKVNLKKTVGRTRTFSSLVLATWNSFLSQN